MIARLSGTIIAPPIPCNVRAAMSAGAFGASPQAIDVTVKMMTPSVNTRRRPYRSPAAPPNSISAPSDSM